MFIDWDGSSDWVLLKVQILKPKWFLRQSPLLGRNNTEIAPYSYPMWLGKGLIVLVILGAYNKTLLPSSSYRVCQIYLENELYLGI